MYYPHDFNMVRGRLQCEGVPVEAIVRRVGTPTYIYSYKTLVDHLRKLNEAFRELHPLICFSVKANGNLAILRLLVREGAGLDVVSGGELYKALRVGCPPSRIVFASVGKRPDEIDASLKAGICCFNVESAAELEAIDAIARRTGRRATVALRINPDVEAHTHRYMTTGVAESKFGIDAKTALTLLRHHEALSGVRIVGFHLHIGSQITRSGPFVEAIRRVSVLLDRGRRLGLSLDWLNLGGGLGIIYKDERPQTPQAFARAVLPVLRPLRVRLILEPGRFIVGNAGILVTRVLYIKDAKRRRLAVVDAGMNDLIRPALYGAYHEVVSARFARPSSNGMCYDIVGPICESADVLARDRRLGGVAAGQLLAVLGAGAYGSTMASNYNGRLRPAEVLVRGRRWAVIRKRETLQDLVRHDVIPKALLS
jgi:diaminopimelate decarboxylase